MGARAGHGSGSSIGGPPETWAELIWRFIETARAAGRRAVLYRVSPALLAACADARACRPYKLGEMAVVDLTRFDLKGGTWSSLRNSLSRASQRDGHKFAILQSSELAVYDELERASRPAGSIITTPAKGFSARRLRADYVLSQPAAVLRLEGRIVAFANLLA